MSKKKRLLLLGGSHAEVPLIRAAQKVGCHVTTLSANQNDFGHDFSDDQKYVDYSDRHKVLDVAIDHGTDAVIAGCNDFAALSAAFVSEALHLKGHDSYEIAELIHHKDKFAMYASSIGLPIPWFKLVNSRSIDDVTLSDEEYPIIVKPTDLTGGKGISVATDRYQLSSAVSKALQISRRDHVLLQQFVSGSYHAVSTIITQGRISFQFFDNEHYFVSDYLVGAASYPTTIDSATQTRIIDSLQTLVTNLNLVDGILHAQLVLDHNNQFFFLDVCRRPPGDLYIKFVEYATSCDYSTVLLSPVLGLSFPDFKTNFDIVSEKFWIRHCLMSKESGVFHSIIFPPGLPGTIVEQVPLVRQGHRIIAPLVQKYEINFVRFNNQAELDQYISITKTQDYISLM
jgi:biotin carboxylase